MEVKIGKVRKIKRRKLTEQEQKRKEEYREWLLECIIADQNRRALAEKVVKQLKNENLLHDGSKIKHPKKVTRTRSQYWR